jgi:hypothetical protein
MATTVIGAPGVIFPDGTTQATAAIAANFASGTATVNVYTSPATFSKPAKPGLKYVKVTVIGAGGNGGDARAQAPSFVNPGNALAAGGGGGGIAIGMFPAASLPTASIPISVGGGGTPSSLGSIISATAGGAGTPQIRTPGIAGGVNGSDASAGSAGTGSTGPVQQLTMTGYRGNGDSTNGNPSWPAGPAEATYKYVGGSTRLFTGNGGLGGLNFATGPASPFPSKTGTGGNGTGYGAGGGGGYATAGLNTDVTGPGGTGSPGVVIIEEYY